MSDPFIGEIRMFAGNFAPRSWAFCDGQLLAISQNDALFSLLGTNYGGDGRTTFGLPDMRGRLSVHAGNGPGLSTRILGMRGGAENVTLTTNQLPSHSHTYNGSTAAGNLNSPAGNVLAGRANDPTYLESPATVQMSSGSVSSAGGSQSHTNLMPFLCVNYIIALFGIYPSRQ